MPDNTNETQARRTTDTESMRVTLDTLLKARSWWGLGSSVRSAKFAFGDLRLRLDAAEPNDAYPHLVATVKAAYELMLLPQEFIEAASKLDGYSYDYQAFANSKPHYTPYISKEP